MDWVVFSDIVLVVDIFCWRLCDFVGGKRFDDAMCMMLSECGDSAKQQAVKKMNLTSNMRCLRMSQYGTLATIHSEYAKYSANVLNIALICSNMLNMV